MNILKKGVITVAMLASFLATTKEALAKTFEEINGSKFKSTGSVTNIKKYFAKEYWEILGITDDSADDGKIFSEGACYFGDSKSYLPVKIDSESLLKTPLDELFECGDSAKVRIFISKLTVEKFSMLYNNIVNEKSNIKKKYGPKSKQEAAFDLKLCKAFFPNANLPKDGSGIDISMTIRRFFLNSSGQSQEMYEPCIYVSGMFGAYKIWVDALDKDGRPESDGVKKVKFNNKKDKNDWSYNVSSGSETTDYINSVKQQIASFQQQTNMNGLIAWQSNAMLLMKKAPYDPKKLPNEVVQLQKSIDEVETIKSSVKKYMIQIGKYLTLEINNENAQEIDNYLNNFVLDGIGKKTKIIDAGYIKFPQNESDYKKLKEKTDKYLKSKKDAEMVAAIFAKSVSDANAQYKKMLGEKLSDFDKKARLKTWLKFANALVADKNFSDDVKEGDLLKTNIEQVNQLLADLVAVEDVSKSKNNGDDNSKDKEEKIELTKEQKEIIKQQKDFEKGHLKKFYKPAEKSFISFMSSGYDFDKMEKNDLTLIMKSIINDDLSTAISYYKENRDNINSLKKIRDFFSLFSKRTLGDYNLQYQPSEKYFRTYIIGEEDVDIKYSRAEIADFIKSFRIVMDKISQ